MLVDVTPLGVTGKEAEHLLDEIGITVNKNGIPFDQHPPNTASGIRLGTPATTSRGFGEDEMREVGRIIIEAIRTATTRRPSAGSPARSRTSWPASPSRASRPHDRAGREAPRPVTFIEGADQSLGPIVAVFVLAALVSPRR